MWVPWQWARRLNDRAIDNARGASLECSRRHVERLEVELYLRRRLETLQSPPPVRRRAASGR